MEESKISLQSFFDFGVYITVVATARGKKCIFTWILSLVSVFEHMKLVVSPTKYFSGFP
jgi:hypothetical protein